MKIQSISVTFHTPRIEECAAFYKKIFGATTVMDSGWYIQLRLPGDLPEDIASISFIHPDHSSQQMSEGQVTLNLEVEDVDLQYRKIVESGVPIARNIEDKEWGDRSFTINDPLGNIIYIYTKR